MAWRTARAHGRASDAPDYFDSLAPAGPPEKLAKVESDWLFITLRLYFDVNTMRCLHIHFVYDRLQTF